MSSIDFYYAPGSPPCRSVSMLATTLGLELNKKFVNTREGENLKPEYVKLNPQHSVPTLVDNGFALWESRAILIYLAEKYGKNDTLYPKDPKEQAVVNQRLFFDMGTLYHSFSEYYYPIFDDKPADPEKLKGVESAFEYLNTFLQGQEYVAGNNLTIADISILSTVSTFAIVKHDFSKYANVQKWYENAKKVVPGWEASWQELLDAMKALEERRKAK